MNFLHHWLCRSSHWRKTLEQRVPWVLEGRDLGSRVLELGPGPGLTTDLLRSSVPHLTALELDPQLASSLRSRLAGSNVNVVTGNAAAMPFADEQFSAGVSITMLHHVPSPALQDQALREMWRVLRPGGIFLGSDSLQSWTMRLIHIGDTLVPLDPVTFGARLTAAGFEGVFVERDARALRFCARRPARASHGIAQCATPFNDNQRDESGFRRNQHDSNICSLTNHASTHLHLRRPCNHLLHDQHRLGRE